MLYNVRLEIIHVLQARCVKNLCKITQWMQDQISLDLELIFQIKTKVCSFILFIYATIYALMRYFARLWNSMWLIYFCSPVAWTLLQIECTFTWCGHQEDYTTSCRFVFYPWIFIHNSITTMLKRLFTTSGW